MQHSVHQFSIVKYEIWKEWIFSNSVSSCKRSRGIFICVCVPKNTRADEKVWKGAPIISALRLAFNNIQGCKHIINTVMRGVGFRGRRRGGSERIRVDGQEGTGPREGKEIVWGYCTSPLAAVTESLEPQRGRMASNPMTCYQAAEAHGALLNEGVTLYTHTHTIFSPGYYRPTPLAGTQINHTIQLQNCRQMLEMCGTDRSMLKKSPIEHVYACV